MSNRRARLFVKSLNTTFRDPVAETRRGGDKGSGAHLTSFGRILMERLPDHP